MKRLAPLRPGEEPTNDMYNKIVASVNSLLNISGRDGIDARVTNNGVTITGTIQKTVDQRKAFVKTPPGLAVEVDCYLDTDLTGAEVTVAIGPIYAGGGNLSTAEPDLSAVGKEFLVYKDNGTWRNVTTFFRVATCP